jgi:peptidoglycan hydrolase-like protein with peptidoglycan-binding domain
MNIFTVPIDKSSTLETIHHLQKILKDLSYYTGDVNGKYSPALQNAIYDFQIENQIIS